MTQTQIGNAELEFTNTASSILHVNRSGLTRQEIIQKINTMPADQQDDFWYSMSFNLNKCAQVLQQYYLNVYKQRNSAINSFNSSIQQANRSQNSQIQKVLQQSINTSGNQLNDSSKMAIPCIKLPYQLQEAENEVTLQRTKSTRATFSDVPSDFDSFSDRDFEILRQQFRQRLADAKGPDLLQKAGAIYTDVVAKYVQQRDLPEPENCCSILMDDISNQRSQSLSQRPNANIRSQLQTQIQSQPQQQQVVQKQQPITTHLDKEFLVANLKKALNQLANVQSSDLELTQNIDRVKCSQFWDKVAQLSNQSKTTVIQSYNFWFAARQKLSETEQEAIQQFVRSNKHRNVKSLVDEIMKGLGSGDEIEVMRIVKNVKNE
ncbi:Hypothetical_protein [Hexamita inflata]|uniref:Hypothetical_protein n=1 Tax=Hexamita inflata TaxID=28002 RepID=A0AA86NIF0_9EUKA|nr:Hypothetical protein HINF_LOCUS7513 [Hexamita inflata]